MLTAADVRAAFHDLMDDLMAAPSAEAAVRDLVSAIAVQLDTMLHAGDTPEDTEDQVALLVSELRARKDDLGAACTVERPPQPGPRPAP